MSKAGVCCAGLASYDLRAFLPSIRLHPVFGLGGGLCTCGAIVQQAADDACLCCEQFLARAGGALGAVGRGAAGRNIGGRAGTLHRRGRLHRGREDAASVDLGRGRAAGVTLWRRGREVVGVGGRGPVVGFRGDAGPLPRFVPGGKSVLRSNRMGRVWSSASRSPGGGTENRRRSADSFPDDSANWADCRPYTNYCASLVRLTQKTLKSGDSSRNTHESWRDFATASSDPPVPIALQPVE